MLSLSLVRICFASRSGLLPHTHLRSERRNEELYFIIIPNIAASSFKSHIDFLDTYQDDSVEGRAGVGAQKSTAFTSMSLQYKNLLNNMPTKDEIIVYCGKSMAGSIWVELQHCVEKIKIFILGQPCLSACYKVSL